MRKSCFTETQIVGIIKESEAGANTKELCPKHGVSPQAFYKWKTKYGGWDSAALRRTFLAAESTPASGSKL